MAPPGRFRGSTDGGDDRRLGRGRSGRPPGAPRPAPGALRRRRDRRLLRCPPRAHALPDRVHPRRGRGEVGRELGPVPRQRRRGRGPVRFAVHDPGPARGPGGAARRGLQRPAEPLGGHRRVGRGASGRRRGRVRVARDMGAPGGRGSGHRARADRGLAGSRPRGQGAGRDRADRGGLCGRRPGAGRPAAGHPARADRSAISPCASNGPCARAARRRSPSTSPACPVPRRPCRTARRAIGRSSSGASCCSISGRRCAAIGAT